ncbi:MAG: Methyltransferase type 11 [Candidatus Parvarchaeum acidophilus ARMAN-5]|uniref:Type II methyltransferase n=1 Tax=Candidatus Parvarchaeum acidophilus ARMAN-5 TaxID=662762 RepID=D6GV64_PARA5|nr:MAG: Methyltransferase type 11 [Candidatus Parvarchaeum acidophilus ARMAN-5]
MKEVTLDNFRDFARTHNSVKIEDNTIEIGMQKQITMLQPTDFSPETTTVWSFPKRGDWATHYLNSKYRGNWAPQIPRNLILEYTNPEDIVLDPMNGSGTTLIECKLLGRNGIGVDINEEAIMIALDRLNFQAHELPSSEIKTFVGDARNLNLIKDNAIDLILTHPPYVNIISYTYNRVEGDLSSISSVSEFIEEINKLAVEFFRVIKPGKYCAILMGDTRRHSHYIPVTFRTMQAFLEAGFALKEDIIKLQWNMQSTRQNWAGKQNFYKIAHEHLFVFRKPTHDERLSELKESIKWW